MHIIILQHIAIEHPGVFLDFFREDGFRSTTVELDEEVKPYLTSINST